MNKFINDTKINFQQISKLIDLGKKPIETVGDYVDWVRDWKEMHTELVAAIKQFRAWKNQAKAESTGEAGIYWERKKSLGRYARMMYEFRTDRKTDLKSGRYRYEDSGRDSTDSRREYASVCRC